MTFLEQSRNASQANNQKMIKLKRLGRHSQGVAQVWRVYAFLLVFVPAIPSAKAQVAPTLSDSARITLITVAPGDELYSTFGHNALRVWDPLNRIDQCYDYGTFDFDQPNFYLNFCLGKLLYTLDVSPYRYFERANLRSQRLMREQWLNLDGSQRQKMFETLETNALPQNRYYKYDFFYDNCATRIRDILREGFMYRITLDSSLAQKGSSMRQLLRPYLSDKPWTQFGIDLVLGMPTDRKARADDYMFLPDYVHDVFAATRLDTDIPLVKAEKRIPAVPFPTFEFKPWFFGNPFWVMLVVALIGLLSMANPRAERIFDRLFWLVLGLAGFIIAFLWFATDHQATKTNLNILWALPTHLLFFWRRTRSEWVENYFIAAAILAALTLVFWKWLPQELPLAATPIAALVVVKGLWRVRKG